MNLEKLREVEKQNCEKMIPSGWNIYDWCREHPETTIANALKRIEKIFDISDFVFSAKSGGKDSSLTAELLCLELSLRKMRAKAGVDRDGNERVDPLDAKWETRRISMMSTNAEVVFTHTNDYIRRFLKIMGPEGHDLLEFNEMCYPIAWQNGASFNSGILISWADEDRNIWLHELSNREELHGYDYLSKYNTYTSNPVRLDSLSEDAQKWHRLNDNVVKVKVCDLWKGDKNDTTEVEAVANYGRGPIKFIVRGGHEKDLQDTYGYFLVNTSWLVDDCKVPKEEIYNELFKRYGALENDVWFLTPSGNESLTRLNREIANDGLYTKEADEATKDVDKLRVCSNMVSLRAEESLDRRTILSQGEYSTGQYSNNNGMNICSPVFDFSTSDVWRLFSATDWDVNEVYERLYQVGVAPADQRVGSLLNYCGIRHISTVKALEADLYGKITARFQGVEFISQFSRSGYFKIGKPKPRVWTGSEHLKAGVDLETLKKESDKYEELLKLLEIPYIRLEDGSFKSSEKKYDGKVWRPLEEYLKENE